MKRCPYCAEEIQDEAVKCKHCGEFLDRPERLPAPGPPPLPSLPAQRLPWHLRTSFIVIMLLSFPPLAIPSVILHPKLSKPSKAVITILILACTWGLWLATLYAHRKLMELWTTLQSQLA